MYLKCSDNHERSFVSVLDGLIMGEDLYENDFLFPKHHVLLSYDQADLLGTAPENQNDFPED